MVAVTSATMKTVLWQAGRPDELIHWEGVCQMKSTLRGYLTVLHARRKSNNLFNVVNMINTNK